MAYIPPEAKWYVAELIEEIIVQGDTRNVVHKSLRLIRADSPEEAYEKAVALGNEIEDSYVNPAGQQVRISFRGLSELNVVYDELDHGVELVYAERTGVPNAEIEKWLLPKAELGVFRPIGPRKLPDYSVREVEQDANRLRGKPSE